MQRLAITGGSGFIGTNLIDQCVKNINLAIENYDIQPPKKEAHRPYWREVDIRHREVLNSALSRFQPDAVIHLAAKTGMDVKDMSELDTNTMGTSTLIEACKNTASVNRVLFTSSLLVCRNGYVPENDVDFCPPNLYGRSKAEMEQIVRDETRGAPFSWVIVRPTSVWGPWFQHSYRTFFRIVGRGLYVHPGRQRIVKPLTFVGNTAHMMMTLVDHDQAQSGVFYLADYPARSIQDWANEIASASNVRRPLTCPIAVLRLGGLAGDLLKTLGWRDPPLSSFRLNNMLTGGQYPIGKTERLVGSLPWTLENGVRETVSWMQVQQ